MVNNKTWLDTMNGIKEAIENSGGGSSQIENIISDKWNNTTTYNVGDYAIYNDTLWRTLVTNVNTPPVEGATWTQEKIAQAINKLNGTLNISNNENFCGYFDGRALYCKNLLGSITTNAGLRILENEIITLVDARGYIFKGNEKIIIGGYLNANYYCGIIHNFNNNNISLFCSPNFVGGAYEITIYYLK